MRWNYSCGLCETGTCFLYKCSFNLVVTIHKTKLNSVALVREPTIPTEQPPLVGEVSAKFCGERASRGQSNGFPRSLISVFQTGAATTSISFK
jgi:hypothetical protein